VKAQKEAETMSKDTRPIEVGDRFETRDKRDAGRVIEVIEALEHKDAGTLPERAARNAAAWGVDVAETEEWMRQAETRFRTRTETHPRNPSAVGNVSSVAEYTLRKNYRRISR
jgi:hypothetical protein